MILKKYAGREGTGNFRAMTLEEAHKLNAGMTIWFVSIQGGARRVKVNGKPKTWKSDTNLIQIPVKYGMREYGYFTYSDVMLGRLLVEIAMPAPSPMNNPDLANG